MRRSGRILLTSILLSVVCATAGAQKLWTTVTMDRSSVYVGQPVQVTIAAYTSTWFTRGVDPGNIKVNGAFSVYFRPVSVSIVEKGQTFAGVELKYLVFPYRDQDVIFPSLDITVETPPEGGYKGVERSLTTEAKSISVKPIPPGFNADSWLVSTNLSVDESWSGNRSNVKVGDVLTRTISRSASGTVSELIPPVIWDSIPAVSLYPARSSVDNQRSRTAISASRTESVRYLFEKEGSVTFPEMTLTWYNPYQSKLYKRTLPEVTIDVQPNPDLGMLESIRDSLAQEQAEVLGQEQELTERTIFGMTPRRFIAVIGLLILGLALIFAFGRLLISKLHEAQEAYRGSEKYYFDQFIKTSKSRSNSMTSYLYRWIDELDLDSPTVESFVNLYGSNQLKDKIARKEELTSISSKEWSEARERMIRSSKTSMVSSDTYWINP